MFVSLGRTQTWRLHTKLYKFGWHTSANNARIKSSKELIFGEVVYVFIIYSIPDFWIDSLNGYDFSFHHTTGENREHNSHTLGWIRPASLYILRVGGLKWEKWKLSPGWQFKVNFKQKLCKIQLEYITYVCHVTNHAQFSTKCIDSKFPLFSNELLNQFYIWIMTDNTYFETLNVMRQNDFTWT